MFKEKQEITKSKLQRDGKQMKLGKFGPDQRTMRAMVPGFNFFTESGGNLLQEDDETNNFSLICNALKFMLKGNDFFFFFEGDI